VETLLAAVAEANEKEHMKNHLLTLQDGPECIEIYTDPERAIVHHAHEDALFVRVTTFNGTFEAGPLLMRAEMLTEWKKLFGGPVNWHRFFNAHFWRGFGSVLCIFPPPAAPWRGTIARIRERRELSKNP